MAFDPYHKWLGIPEKYRPPTYYQLLGIEPDERDPDVIEEAAIRQTTHLRAFQAGAHAESCTRLLNEISEARTTLVDPAKRKAYDAKLAKKRSSTSVRAQADVSSPLGDSVSVGDSGRVRNRIKSIEKQAVKAGLFGDEKTKYIVFGVGGGVALVAIVLVLIFAFKGDSPDTVMPPETVKNPLSKTKLSNDNKVEPKKEPPKKVEPKKEPPKKVEPIKEPPKKVEPIKEPPKKVEPKKEPPKKVEPKSEPPKKVESKSEPPKQTPTGIDLLALIDPEKHALAGKWTMKNGKLKTDKGVIYIPYDKTNGAYELTIRTRNLADDKGEHFCVGIVAGNYRTLAAVNALGGIMSGLERVDGIPIDQSETKNPLGILPPGKEHVIKYRVVNHRITVSINGDTVTDWKGDLRRLTDILAKPFKIPTQRLYFYLKGPYEISQIEFYPLPSEVAMKYAPTPRPRIPANGFAFERALNTVGKWHKEKMSPTFVFASSWRFMFEFRLIIPHKREPRSNIFFWGDSGPGKNALHIIQKESTLYTAVWNAAERRVHNFITELKPNNRYRWVEFDLHYNAIKREFAFYLDGRLVKREVRKVIPQATDRPLPIFLGSRDKGIGRFKGWIRRVWLGNVRAEDLPVK